MNIKHKMQYFLSSFCTVGVLFLVTSFPSPQNAHADMKELFDQAMLNVNGRTRIDAGGRNGYSLGGFGFRSELVNPNLISMTLPSAEGGCGGIDFYGGSFSMINSDQLVQAMRGVMQGAASYAFGLALSSLCPTCKQLATELQKKMEQINNMARDACQAATGVIGEKMGEDFLTLPVMKADGTIGKAMSVASSDLGSNDLSWSMFSESDKSLEGKANESGQTFIGNATWKFMHEADTESWTVNIGAINFSDVMLSMIGYEIYGLDVDDDAVVELTVAPMLTPEDFFGKIDGDTSPITYMECNNKGIGPLHTQCLSANMVEKTIDDWEGVVRIIQKDFKEVLTEIQNENIIAHSNPEKRKSLEYISIAPNLQNILIDANTDIQTIAQVLAIAAARNLIPKAASELKYAISVIQSADVEDSVKAQGAYVGRNIERLNLFITDYVHDFDQALESKKNSLAMISLLRGKK